MTLVARPSDVTRSKQLEPAKIVFSPDHVNVHVHATVVRLKWLTICARTFIQSVSVHNETEVTLTGTATEVTLTGTAAEVTLTATATEVTLTGAATEVTLTGAATQIPDLDRPVVTAGRRFVTAAEKLSRRHLARVTC